MVKKLNFLDAHSHHILNTLVNFETKAVSIMLGETEPHVFNINWLTEILLY